MSADNPPTVDELLDADVSGAGRCDPIPWKGKQGLFTVRFEE